MATNALRGHLTPIELESDQTPSTHHLMPWYAKCVVVAPKEKCKLRGDVLSRGEEGRFLGYQAVNSKVYKVMLNDRLVHAIHGNVSFDFGDAIHPQDDVTNQPEEAHQPHSEFEMGFKSEEALQLESAEEANPTVAKYEKYEKHMPGAKWYLEQWYSKSDDDKSFRKLNKSASLMNNEVLDHVRDAKLAAIVK